MKIVQRTGPGEVGLNYMWLPTWIGMNGALIKDIEQHISSVLLNQPLTDEVLDHAGDAVVQYLSVKFPNLKGIFEYLDGLKYVETDGEPQKGQHQASALQEKGRSASHPTG